MLEVALLDLFALWVYCEPLERVLLDRLEHHQTDGTF